MRKTHHGSCHCGAVRFQVELDLAPEGDPPPGPIPAQWTTASRRCNCSFCGKTRFWKMFVPADAFRLLQGEASLSDYRGPQSEWPEGDVHHYFCGRCGVRGFTKARLEIFGGEFYAINLATLDDASDAELAAVPIRYEDGRNDAFESAPAETRHL